jgi:hypothetical protein
VELVDVILNRRAIGHTYMRDDRLEPALTPRGKRRTRLSDTEKCSHESVKQAFAHRRSRDEHWPIVYCADCCAILAGLDPLVRRSLPRWKFHEQNLAVARWTRDWPKAGKPRQDAPPADVSWIDAA